MFEFLRTLSVDAVGRRAVGEARVDCDHPFLADHFPGHPVLPGSMALELAAQVAGPLAEEVVPLEHQRTRYAFLAKVRSAQFVRPVHLPATLRFEAQVKRSDAAGAVVTVTGRNGQELMLRGELLLVMMDADGEWQGALEERRRRVERWKQAAEMPS